MTNSTRISSSNLKAAVRTSQPLFDVDIPPGKRSIKPPKVFFVRSISWFPDRLASGCLPAVLVRGAQEAILLEATTEALL